VQRRSTDPQQERKRCYEAHGKEQNVQPQWPSVEEEIANRSHGHREADQGDAGDP
jgi:hypothetical protein